MKTQNGLTAQARREGLVTRELENETLVYDLTRNRAHCLNETAALVWKNCDGHTTLPQMTEFLGKELDVSVDERLVLFALDKLGKAHLLEERITLPPEGGRMSRREAVRRLGMGAALAALPVVMSIVAPTAVSAATCTAVGQQTNCMNSQTSNACCSRCCNTGPNPDVCLQAGLPNGASCVKDCQCSSGNCNSGCCKKGGEEG